MENKILDLLARGLSQVEVSRALGVTESYISQIVHDPDNIIKLQELKAKRLTVASNLDDYYDQIETKAVGRLVDITDKSAQMMTPDQLIKIAKFSNEAKRRNATDLSPNNTNVQALVVITLPTGNIPGLSVVKSSTNEVLEMQGKSLLPMDTKTLLARNNQQNLSLTMEDY